MKKSQTVLNIMSILLSLILLGLLIWFGISNFKAQKISSCPIQEEMKIVRGNSLEPLVLSGSQIKALFGYYDCHEIKRNDLVLYRYAGDKIPLLKIVKGVPKDTFQLVLQENGSYKLVINGEVVVNSQGISYTFSGNRYKMLALYERDYKGIIPENTYLLLGDQINGSVDSSVFGLIDKSDIIGKAVIYSN
jgi:signal peptidase I